MTTDTEYIGILFWNLKSSDTPLSCRYPSPAARTRDTHWATLCNLWEQAGASRRTMARQLLAYEPARRAVRDAMTRGLQYSNETNRHGNRRLVAEAIAILQKRDIRRLDRTIAEGARQRQPGRIVRALAGRIALRRDRKRNRTHDLIEIAAAYKFRRASGKWAGGEHTTTVNFIGDINQIHPYRAVSARGCSTNVRSANGKWKGKNSDHLFVVPENWIETVHDAGIDRVDDCVTLSAEPVTDETTLKGCEAAWRVIVAKQSTGFDLKTAEGFVVMFAGKTHFGKTITTAKKKCAADWQPVFAR